MDEIEPTDPAEIYALKNHIDIELAQLMLANIAQYDGSPHSGLLRCMKPLFIDSLSQLSAELTWIEKKSFELLTRNDKITPHQQIALIRTLFLVASKEVQSIIFSPWLLTYLLHAKPDFDKKIKLKLFVHLEIDNDERFLDITTEDLIEELEEREGMLTELAEQFKIGSTIPCAAANYCSFDDAAKVCKASRDHRSIQEAQESRYNNSCPYNRYNQHILIEVDPRRPRKEIDQQIKAVLDDNRQWIREEDQANENPLVIEWEISKKQVKTALASYLLVKTIGWRQQQLDARNAVQQVEGQKIRRGYKELNWRTLVCRLREIEITFNIRDDADYIDNFIKDLNGDTCFAETMKKWTQNHMRHAEKLLNAARNQEKISNITIGNNRQPSEIKEKI